MYCFMMMTTTKAQDCGTTHAYEMKLLRADTPRQLLDGFLTQAEAWLMAHPDGAALDVSEFSINHLLLRFPRLVQFEGSAESDLPDILHNRYELTAPDGLRCVISAYGCWGYDFREMASELNDAHIIPCTPRHFDSTAIASAAEYTNDWNRTAWEIKFGIQETGNFMEEINAELALIAHNPHLGSFSLKYFEGAH